MRRRCAFTGLIASFWLAGAACTPMSEEPAEPEPLVSWVHGEDRYRSRPLGGPPVLMTGEEELNAWVLDQGLEFRAEIRAVVDETLAPALEQQVLVAILLARCTEVAALHVEEADSKYSIRIDLAEVSSDDRCSTAPAGLQIWSVPRDATGGEPPAAVTTSHDAGDETSAVLGVGSIVWWQHLGTSPHPDLQDELPDAFTRLHSTQEHHDEVIATLETLFPEPDRPLEGVRSINASESFLVLTVYDDCAGAQVEILAEPAATPPQVWVRHLSHGQVVCEAPSYRLEVWEVPRFLVGEDAELAPDRLR